MRLWLDGASLPEIVPWLRRGIVTGLTTNPLVLGRAGFDIDSPEMRHLIETFAPYPVCAQVTATTPSAAVECGLRLSSLGDNVVIKVPVCSADGSTMLDAIHELAEAKVKVNATLCFSSGQALLAASAGASYVSLLVGRIADEGGDPSATFEATRLCLETTGSKTEIVAASIRSPGDLTTVIRSRPHIATLSPAVLSKLSHHHFSAATAQEMLDD